MVRNLDKSPTRNLLIKLQLGLIGIIISMDLGHLCALFYCKTKLKLDKEVGGGDLSEPCTITYLIAYPYA